MGVQKFAVKAVFSTVRGRENCTLCMSNVHYVIFETDGML